MTNKQQSTTAEDWDAKLKLELTAENLKEWITESYTKQKQALNEIREKMIDDGVPPDIAARCVAYEETPEQYVNKQRFKLWSNKKSGRLNDVPTLVAAGLISDAEIEAVRADHNWNTKSCR